MFPAVNKDEGKTSRATKQQQRKMKKKKNRLELVFIRISILFHRHNMI